MFQKRFQKRVGPNGGILDVRPPWTLDPRLIPDWSQELGIGPLDHFGPPNDPKMTSKWLQNGTIWMRNHNKMSRDLCVWWNRKSRPQVVCKQKRREFRPCRSHFSKQNSRTVPSESERSIENMARVPSMQTVVFCCSPAAQYTADAKAVKKWRAFRPYKWLFCTMHRPHSTQRARKLLEKMTRAPSM